jgi:hypothetical protein
MVYSVITFALQYDYGLIPINSRDSFERQPGPKGYRPFTTARLGLDGLD